ncbi:hypothetical protein GCM10010160_67270 [Acrocarpospora corrugata]
MGRPAEAIDFHRRAATVFRDLDDRWQLALALDNLGIAQRLAGEATSAERNWRRALDILADFEDPKARSMRSLIAEILSGPL